ncbi:SDH family Clp fold serine proteinase [Pseudoxanthomonas winnipegensis]|nr:hypothetical protein [Pseudoxanthomonas winnipegensis]
MSKEDAVAIANMIASENDCDVFVYSAGFDRGPDMRVIAQLSTRNRRPRALLLLTSSGGDADAAYRIARAFQSSYQHVTAFVPGWCKSAGTLCVLGAHELVVGDFGELGPLDVQLQRKDEIGEYGSGLAVVEALEQVQRKAFHAFEGFMLQIKQRSLNAITFKLAAELAAKMAVELHEPITRQIDPLSIGEQSRAMTIAKDYGARLQLRSKNFTEDMLDFLIESYPSHGFVIDRLEASAIFKNVREPTELEEKLALALGRDALIPNGKLIEFFSDELEIQDEQPLPTEAEKHDVDLIEVAAVGPGDRQDEGDTPSPEGQGNEASGDGNNEEVGTGGNAVPPVIAV